LSFTEEEQAFMERFTDAIVKRHLTVPAIFFLESMTPVNFVASQAVAFFTPIVQIFLKAGDLDILQRLLEDRRFLPTIIRLMEKKDAVQRREERELKQLRREERRDRKQQVQK